MVTFAYTNIDESLTQAIELIYSYWFGENIDTWSKTYPLKTKLWFKSDERVDQEIEDKFEHLLVDAATSESHLHQRWQTTPRGTLALILLFDQFARNIYRGTSKMFDYDPIALKLALEFPFTRASLHLPSIGSFRKSHLYKERCGLDA